MSSLTHRACAGVVLSLVIAPAAQGASEDFSATIGLKAWATRWTTSVPTTVPGLPSLVNLQFTTDAKVAYIPTLSLRWKDWYLSASDLPSTNYEVSGFGLKRKESDVNLGYRLAPGLVASIGYKRLEFNSGATLGLGGSVGLAKYQSKGPFAGLSGGAAVGQDLSIVGTLGFGSLKTQYDGTGATRYSSQYVLAELGMSYRLPFALTAAGASSVMVGYRHQTLTVKADAFALGQRYRDVTQGLTTSLAFTF